MEKLGEFRSRNKFKKEDIEGKKKTKESMNKVSSSEVHPRQNVSELFGKDIIKRAPDKMIDIIDNHILLAYRNSIIYLDVSQYGIYNDDIRVRDDLLAERMHDEHFIPINVEREQLLFFELQPKYKIICIQEIGNEMSAFVLEDIVSRQIRFLRANFQKIDNIHKLKLIQLGVFVNATKLQPSKLMKYRAVSKTDKKTGKRY